MFGESQTLPLECGESDFDLDALRMEQLNIIGIRLRTDYSTSEEEEIRTSPIVSVAAKKSMDRRGSNTKSLLPQYGLLAGRIDLSKGDFALSSKTPKEQEALDPRLFLNVNAPWSAFICGSQGSGKSHSMCCILENCLLSHPAINLLPSPLAGLVFHYDSFTSDVAGQVCEAAYLCSSGIDITVLVSPSNLPHMVELYENLPGLPVSASKPKVEPLLLDQKYLNAERLMTLMAAGNSDGAVPLYMQTVLQTLRDMAREPKRLPGIDYGAFKSRVLARPLTPSQLGPLELRLDLLESFLALPKSNMKRMKTKGNSWTPAGGKLIIVDLSCPFVDADTACALFGICLGIFLEQRMDIGRIIALDEAHKFMRNSVAANKLTDTLTSAVRLQRHLACRVVIATQEPTVSPRLIDLCSMTLVHRFASPHWLDALNGHLAGIRHAKGEDSLLEEIINLNTGEALLFAPAAKLAVEERIDEAGKTIWKPRSLGSAYVRVRIRDRMSSDGGRSICAFRGNSDQPEAGR